MPCILHIEVCNVHIVVPAPVRKQPMSSTTAPRTFAPRLVLAVLCLGSLSGALMQSLVIPIQSELPRLLHTDAGSASWAVTATLLAAAVTMPVSGRLADMYGKKRVLVVSAGLPSDLVARIKQALINYSQTEQGSTILKTVYNITAFAEPNVEALDIVRQAAANLNQ